MDIPRFKFNIAKRLDILNEVAKALLGWQEIEDIPNIVMNCLAGLLDPTEFGAIFLLDTAEGDLGVKAAFGKGLKDVEAIRQLRLAQNESVVGKAFTTLKPQLFKSQSQIMQARNNLSKINEKLLQQAYGSLQATSSFICAPLCLGDFTYGVIVLGTLEKNRVYSERDIPFIQMLANLIAFAIDRSRLEIEQTKVEQIRQSDLVRAEALAVLSHELRTPLASIKGYTTALMLDEVDWSEDKQNDFLQLIDNETDNLQTMITDILDSSLIDTGRFSLEYQPVRLERLAEEVAKDYQRRSEIHQLVVDFPDTFPIIDADERRIQQVIRNIVDNAVKYSPEGGLIVIRGEVRETDVTVSISDQGVGISPEDLIPLFDKYFRVKSPTGFYVPGTGLGLPVARVLVEEHNGNIWADSKLGEGTTLFFSLPISRFEAE
ncbi:MAG: ATP-binding protein [Anaerolineales bacterium]|jgi:K+-sensing histidine kinase KdpD